MGQQKHNVRFHMLAIKAGETTRAYYEQFLRGDFEKKYPGHMFSTEVSANGPTCFGRPTPRRLELGKFEFYICYSERVFAETEGPNCQWRAGNWLHYKEIVELGYAGGVATPEALIVHAMCHEIAHMRDFLEFGRQNGRAMHDKVFYATLDTMYEEGAYEWLRSDYLQRLRQIGIKRLRQFSFVPQREEYKLSSEDFEVGDRVLVYKRKPADVPWRGVVVKKGPERAQVAFGRAPSWQFLPSDLEGGAFLRAVTHSRGCIEYWHYGNLLNESVFKRQAA